MSEGKLIADKDAPNLLRFEGDILHSAFCVFPNGCNTAKELLLQKTRTKELLRRWNAHEDLVAAYRELYQKFSDYGRISHPDSTTWIHDQQFKDQILTKAEAALAVKEKEK